MQAEKKTPFTHTSSLDDSELQTFADPQWQTGKRARFPWMGFTALLTVLLCAVSSIIVLLVSDDKSIHQWSDKIAPSIILSGLNSLSNICFGVAIGNGVAITWWRKALKGATIKELHRSWTFSSSIKDIVLGGKYFNFIALAALAAKLTIVDGILLQEAARRVLHDDPGRNITVSSYANTTIPLTGFIGDRSGNVSSLYEWFITDLGFWSGSGATFQNSWATCNGTCLLDIPGAGFEIDCSSEVTAIDYGEAAAQDQLALSQLNDTSTFNGTYEYTLMDVSFQVIYGITGIDDDYSKIVMSVSTTHSTMDQNNSASCPGHLNRQSCILRPAIIRYPVTIEDTSENRDNKHPISNMYLGHNTTLSNGVISYSDSREYEYAEKQQAGFAVIGYKDILEDHRSLGNQATAIGGIAKALSSYFAGSSSMHYDPSIGYVLSERDSAKNEFSHAPATPLGCDFDYANTLDSIVQQINLLMFGLTTDSLGLNSENNDYSVQTTFNAIQYGSSIHYKTNRNYMFGALASMLVCVLCVLPTYWGYWQLGRDVTLGPMEIANAFRAPVLDHPAVANAGVKELIKEVGKREVKYGELVINNAHGRLAIAESDAVRRVHPRLHDSR